MAKFHEETVEIILPEWLEHSQLNASLAIFRDAADEDYVIARSSWKDMIKRQFFWSANQAIEKYLKSALLCNNMDARFRHDWFGKYEIIRAFALNNKLDPLDVLQSPATIDPKDTGFSYEEQTIDFMRRLYENGNSTIRYNEFAWFDVEVFDLHKLDSVIRWLRGLCFPVDGDLVYDSSQIGNPDPSMLGIKKLARRQPVLGISNFAFFPGSAKDPILWVGISASPITILILKDETAVIEWLKNRTFLDRSYPNILKKVETNRGKSLVDTNLNKK